MRQARSTLRERSSSSVMFALPWRDEMTPPVPVNVTLDLGATQQQLRVAFGQHLFDSTLTRDELFDPATNLRIGLVDKAAPLSTLRSGSD